MPDFFGLVYEGTGFIIWDLDEARALGSILAAWNADLAICNVLSAL
jgi:hypothetical protein